jgi:FlaA1/EpsC-like NDP-sugar epimerase
VELSLVKSVLAWPRSVKRLVVLGVDIASALVATWVAFSLRFDVLHWPQGGQWAVYALSPVLAIPVFTRHGLYRSIFRYTGMAAMVATVRAVTIYAGLFIIALLAMRFYGLQGGAQGMPRSVGVLQPLLFLLLVGGSRAIARFWLAGLLTRNKRPRGRLLVYGAGTSGVQTAAAIAGSRAFAMLGFIDDDASKVGRHINGVRVYAAQEAADVVRRFGITDILLALPSISRQRRREILERLQGLPVHVRTLPGIVDLASGRVTVQDFRELEIEDLLGREATPPNAQPLAQLLAGQVVMVTGAGGSIGSELCRQILREAPARLVLVDHNEFGLYSIDRELREICDAAGHAVELVPTLGSVQSYERMAQICRDQRPGVIYHAAAYKHVPLVESNIAEAVLNNVFGTVATARAAMECRARHMVLVSTDKAVRPTNFMGVTKRVAEQVLQALAAVNEARFERLDDGPPHVVGRGTCFSMVRFGNVLGSSGSVVPLFRRQIEAGGPLTVTHEDVTRYFMTIPEAAQLVLQAGVMAGGGEVFVLDMGQPVRILELARKMIALSGLVVRDRQNPDGDIEIAVTGLRPGEKLTEELLIGADPATTAHPRIMMAREAYTPWARLASLLAELRAAALRNDDAAIQGILHQLVPESHLREPLDTAPASLDVNPRPYSTYDQATVQSSHTPS